MRYYAGALHMHTVYSDGTGTVEELAHAAHQAGLRWIIITDHDTLEPLRFAGWIENVLVIVGHEITPDHNHFLALNVDTVVDRELPPQDYIDEVYARGGFGIIAHPDERVKNDFKDIYRWDDWTVDGPRARDGKPVGIELWNVMSDWSEQLTSRNTALNFLMPRRGLTGPTAATLDWWDRLNATGKPTFGVGGVDAHAFKKKAPWGEVEVFSYRWMFGTLTNYLLFDTALATDATEATHQVYAALAAGRSYFINRIDGLCPELAFFAQCGTERYDIGSSPRLHDGLLTLVADAGVDAQLRLIHNGSVRTRAVRALRQTIDKPGTYRLEGYRKGRPWLFSNPIYVQE